MSKINIIQQKLKELDGGEFQKLFDTYIKKKYKFDNITPLGAHDGSNKPTKGIPDSYVICDDGSYILIMSGSTGNTFKKLKDDILSCLNFEKTKIHKDKIKKIICGHCSSNISMEQNEELKKLSNGIELEIIGIGILSNDLLEKFPNIALDFLGIPLDTRQMFTLSEFVEVHDKSGTNAPLNTKFMYKEKEADEIKNSLLNNNITLITGSSGIGKTKIALEALKSIDFQNHIIFAIKSNGITLYDDINMYISDPGQYILFIDDANQISDLKFILSFANNPPQDISIKLIMTVRDYAKNKVLNEVYNYCKPNVIEIKKFEDEQIKEIIKNDLNILNNHYLDRITYIAKGNIRIAIISALIAKNGSLHNINDVWDIFKLYYSDILNNQHLDKKEILAIFIIGLIGPLNISENESKSLQAILNILGLSDKAFKESCFCLNDKEIIDLYENRTAIIADQSLKDFLFNYVLVEKKYITITELLDNCFSLISQQIIDALNTIINLFYSQDTMDYVRDQVITSWHKETDENNKINYIKSFYSLNEDEALLYIKNQIQNIPEETFDLSNVDFREYLNNCHYKTIITEILSGFYYCKNFSSAFDLLLELSTKNLDYAKEVCRIICQYYIYDKKSLESGFEKEKYILDCLWNYSNSGKNFNSTIIMIEVIKQLLDVESFKSEQGRSNRTVNFITIHISLNDKIKKIRKQIWNILSILYSNKQYQNLVGKILYDYHISAQDEKSRKAFMKFDMHCFEEEFKTHIDNNSFEIAVILHQLESTYKWINNGSPKFLSKYNDNEEFHLICPFLIDIYRNMNWRLEEKKKQKIIYQLVETLKFDDFKKLFVACKKYEQLRIDNENHLGVGLCTTFKKLEENQNYYVEIAGLYFETRCPYYISVANDITYNLIRFIGPNATKNLIDTTQEKLKSTLLECFYRLIPKDNITNTICNELEKFIESEISNKSLRILNVYSLEKYLKIDPLIINKITELIINSSDNTSYLIFEFLNRYLSTDYVERLMRLYKNNIELLEEIYFRQLEYPVDLQNLLFDELIKNGLDFWQKFSTYIIKIKNHRDHTLCDIFEKIWNKEDYKDYINITIDKLFNDEFITYKYHDIVSSIFGNSRDTKEKTIDNKKQYIKDFIMLNINQSKKLSIIFKIISEYFGNDKLEFFNFLVNLNNSFEIFKNIPLFSWHYSWCGSEIPIIDKKLKFLNDLLEIINGPKFIEHRNHVNRKIEIIKNERKNVLEREYIEHYELY